MKRLLTIAILAAASVAGYAQTNTNTPPILNSPVFEFLTQGSNYVVATYGIYDMTSHKAGAGVGIGYKASPYLVPTLRLDAVVDPTDNKLAVFCPSGNLQLQAPVRILGKVTATPFAYAGVGGKFGGNTDTAVVGIFGAGLAVELPSKAWYVPSYLLGDYEHWTGAGFNNNQVRFGLGWKL